MPELKNTFTGGRMEKDLDERIVPSGSYREALNIGVSTSEDSDVGAAQNILGNTKVTEVIQGPPRKYSSCAYGASATPRYIGTNDHIVATVDPQTDMIYRFVATVPTSSNDHGVWMDRIIEYDTTKSITDPWHEKEKSVFVDIYKVETTIVDVTTSGVNCNKSTIKVCKNSFQLREGMVINDSGVYIETISYGSLADTRTTITLSENIDSSISTGNAIVFTADRVLNFHVNRSITGLNIMDGLIFWTDNYSEPKKINIERSKLGSNSVLYGAGYQFDKNGNTVGSPTSYDGSSGHSYYSDFEMHTKLIINDAVAVECDKDESDCQVLGCTDSSATNYDIYANVDDNSCTYPVVVDGCTDPVACNYDVNANNDDGSCEYATAPCEECDYSTDPGFVSPIINALGTDGTTFCNPPAPEYVCIKAGFDNDDCADNWGNIQDSSRLDTNGTSFYENPYADPIREIYWGGASVGTPQTWPSIFHNGMKLGLYNWHFWVYQNSATYDDGNGGPGVGHQASFNPNDPNEVQTCIDVEGGVIAGYDHRFKSRIVRFELWEVDAAEDDTKEYNFNGTSGSLPTTWDQLIFSWPATLNYSSLAPALGVGIIPTLRNESDSSGGGQGYGFGFNGVETDMNKSTHQQRAGVPANIDFPGLLYGSNPASFNDVQNELLNGLILAPRADGSTSYQGELYTDWLWAQTVVGNTTPNFITGVVTSTIVTDNLNIKFFLNVVTEPCNCSDFDPLEENNWAQNFDAQSDCVIDDNSYDFGNPKYSSHTDEAACLASNCYTSSPLQWNNLRSITELENSSPLKMAGGGGYYGGGNGNGGVSYSTPHTPQTIVNPIRGGEEFESSFDHICRPVYVQEKHVAVVRKGPTAPPKLQMYKWEDDADISDIFSDPENLTASGITADQKIIVQTTFSGKEMPQKDNWDTNIMATPDPLWSGLPIGTGADGSDVSIFYTPTKELLAADAEIILPIDVLNPSNPSLPGSGQGFLDWQSNDKLLITYSFTDTNGNTITATCRVRIIDPIFGVGTVGDPAGGGWDSNSFGYTGGAIYKTNVGPYNTHGGILCQVLQIDKNFPVTGTKNIHIYTVKKELQPPLFEKKFPKFSYRYKFEDGEYSVFAPWSEIAFMPSKFDYLPKKGYNLGMVNTMRSLKILDWNPKNRPKDVVEIDLLYKESNSPNVYTVKTFKPTDIEWREYGTGANQGVVAIQSELIHKTVPSNQMLRPWDNVPRVALGQEITANRLIFANYVQNYDIEVKPVFSTSISTNIKNFQKLSTDFPKEPFKSLKSMRNYQIGVVYRDRYGRETPVLTDPTGSVEVPKKDAKYQNRLQVKMMSDPPSWAESFTFYIKETSNEYYNLAMDRWYNANDDGIWLSFPSSERNKLSERSVLLLKKQHNSDIPVDSDVKYKVIDIKNDAPKFIKTEYQFWGSLPMMLPPPGWGVDGKAGNWDTGMFHLTGLPLPNRLYIDVYAEYFDQSVLSGLMDQSSAQIRVVQSSGQSSSYNAVASQSVNKSHWYDISAISYIGSPAQTYEEETQDPSGATIVQEVEIPGQAEQIVRITLETIMGEDMAFCESTDNLSLSRGLALEARTSIVRDKAQFQGRFFVKVLRDAEIQAHIVQSGKSAEDYWQVLMNRDVKYVAMAHPGVQEWRTDGQIVDDSGTLVNSVGMDAAASSASWGKWTKNPDELNVLSDFNYIPVGKLWEQNTVYGGTLNVALPHTKAEVSSYHQHAGDASYYNSLNVLSVPPTDPTEFWPMGPGFYANVALKSGYYYLKYIDFIKAQVAADYHSCHVANTPNISWFGGCGNTPIWPDTSASQHNWPSYYLSEWQPDTCGPDCSGLKAEHYPGDNFDSGLDLSTARINGARPLFNNTLTFPDNNTAVNPMNVPAVWGDPSDTLGYTLNNSTGVRTKLSFNALGGTPSPESNFSMSGGLWTIARFYSRAEWQTETIEKLRSGFYYMYYGRDKIDNDWPLGRFEPERWFIDKCGAAKGYSGAGIWDAVIGGTTVSRMDLSFYGIGNTNTHQRNHNMNIEQPSAVAFAELIATVGTQFRFQQDPNQTVYTVTEAKISGIDYEEIYNYETDHGSWAERDPDNPGQCKGGRALGEEICPPWGGDVPTKTSIAGKPAFFSDLYNQSLEMTGGAPYNYRKRITITLNKKIGTEGVMINANGGFHPILNHVNIDGNCNIKGGPQRYSSLGADAGYPDWKANIAHPGTGGGFPEGIGGIPNHQKYYNLSSYWNKGTENTTGQSDLSGVGDIDGQHFGLHERGLNSTTIEIVTPYKGDEGDKEMSTNPAVWETEPMEDVGLDIYYAASPSYPVSLNKIRSDEGKPDPTDIDPYGNLTNAHYADYNWRGEEIVPVGAHVEVTNVGGSAAVPTGGATVIGVQGDTIWVSGALVNHPASGNLVSNGFQLKFSWKGEGHYYGAKLDDQFVTAIVEKGIFFNQFKVKLDSHSEVQRSLSYFNCYSFSNGVESNRVRDDYNAVTIDKGVKASMPLAEGYEEERKASSLIFSGIYNSTSGVNRTNQFIQAEPITKDLNPINGSIQKLFARDTDLVTFCENKVFKVLAKKDALFNADGNTNVTSNAAVLGQAIPFSGEYGISTNPESFASQSYRVYFADRSRGSVLRLSRDGMTPISDKGMKDWFKDNLWAAETIIGSYDEGKDQYNITLETADQDGMEKAYTLSWVEDKKGWVSFKSFVQQDGISHKNIYYTFASNKYSLRDYSDPWGVSYISADGNLAEMWQHNLDIRFSRAVVGNSENSSTVVVGNSFANIILEGMNAVGDGIPIDTTVLAVTCVSDCTLTLSNNVWISDAQSIDFSMPRDNFYNKQHYSMVKTLFNKDQGNVKRFKTLNYEGSQSQVIPPDSFANISNDYTLYDWQGNPSSGGQIMRDNYMKKGWYAHNLITDLQTGSVKEFVNKENKWFDYIRGKEEAGVGDILDTGDFSLQGLGVPTSGISPTTCGNGGTGSFTAKFGYNCPTYNSSSGPPLQSGQWFLMDLQGGSGSFTIEADIGDSNHPTTITTPVALGGYSPSTGHLLTPLTSQSNGVAIGPPSVGTWINSSYIGNWSGPQPILSPTDLGYSVGSIPQSVGATNGGMLIVTITDTCTQEKMIFSTPVSPVDESDPCYAPSMPFTTNLSINPCGATGGSCLPPLINPTTSS